MVDGTDTGADPEMVDDGVELMMLLPGAKDAAALHPKTF